MLRKFTINGFKSIRSAEMEFGRVNLFIGGNGAGKSNILEALGVLSACLKDLSEIELQKRGVRLSVPALFKSAFMSVKFRPNFGLEAEFDHDVRYDVAVRCGDTSESMRFLTERIRHGQTQWMGRGPNGVKIAGAAKPKADVDATRGLWDLFRQVVDGLPSALSEELNRMARFAIYAPQTAFLRGTEIESLAVKPLGLQGGGLPQAAQAVTVTLLKQTMASNKKELIKEILSLAFAPKWAQSISVAATIPNQVSSRVRTGDLTLYFIDKFMRTGRRTLSAYDSSEGTLFLLFLAVLILHPDSPKIFAFDNIDNSLNPAMTTQMLTTLIDATCDEEFKAHGIGPDQVFLTSHNPSALDAFDLFEDDQRVFVVSRAPETGYTQVTRLKPEAGWTKADWIEAVGGRSLSELWIEGRIKGALGL